MMYFTVRSIPRKLTRVTTYEVRFRGKTSFKVVFKQSVNTNYLGSFIRYSDYFVPKNAAYGVYVYRGTLSFDGRSATRTWKFAILRTASVTPMRTILRE